MKPKPILCLALVLSGGLIGLSNHGAASQTASQKIFDEQPVP